MSIVVRNTGWRLKRATFNNMYSFGQGVLCIFPEGDIVKTLISGINHDEVGSDSNGAGKSNILNSVYWCIFGIVFQEENIDTIIRKGETWCSTEIVLFDGTNELIIARGHGAGKKAFLTVTYNGDSKLYTLNTPTVTQAALNLLLGIPPRATAKEYTSDFINTVYFSSDVVKGFMGKKTSSKERFALVERYLGLRRYSLASEKAKEKKKGLLDSIAGKLDKVAEYEQFLQVNSEDILNKNILDNEQTKTRLQITLTKNTEILTAQSEIHTLKNVTIPNKQQQLTTTRNTVLTTLTSLENQHGQNVKNIASNLEAITQYRQLETWVLLQSPIIDQLRQKNIELAAKIKQEQEGYTVATNEVAKIKDQEQNLRNQMANHHKCPSCGTALMVRNNILEHVDVAAMQTSIDQLVINKTQYLNKAKEHTQASEAINELIKNNEKVLTDYTVSYQSLGNMAKPDTLEAANVVYNSNNTLLMQQYNDISAQAEQDVAVLKTDLVSLTEKYESLKASALDLTLIEQEISHTKTQISVADQMIGQSKAGIKLIQDTRSTLTTLQAEIKAIKQEAEVYAFWETGFHEIKLNIIDEFLPDFEDRVNQYLDRLKVSLRISFDTQKEKANVTKKDREAGRAFKEEFNVEVCKTDNVPIPYGLLSKGQRGRVGTCVGMALRELTQERGNNLFDFFFLDEIADSLDVSGLRELVQLLDETSGQKLVISHDTFLKDLFDSHITVELENEVSTIRNVGV